MTPMKAVRLQLGALLAADASTLAPAVGGNKMALIAANFAVDETLTIASLTFATFTGSAAKTCGVGTQTVGQDPATGAQIITILAPAGGFVWVCSVTPGAPETIYGVALTDNAGAVLLTVEKLSTPVVVAAAGHEVRAGNLGLTISPVPAA